MLSVHHPTKAKLIDATLQLLGELPRDQISSELILSTSGISKGSMYHHFEDLDHLIEHAMLLRYTNWVDVSIAVMSDILINGKNAEDIYEQLTAVTKRTQDPAMKTERLYRAEVLAMAAASPRLARNLRDQQQRLTDSLTDLIREVQELGYYKKEFDPRVIAVFIQAYTLGKVVDDFSDNPMNPENWNFLINSVIKKVLSTLE
jgi:AcrR family transcriptional regulator